MLSLSGNNPAMSCLITTLLMAVSGGEMGKCFTSIASCILGQRGYSHNPPVACQTTALLRPEVAVMPHDLTNTKLRGLTCFWWSKSLSLMLFFLFTESGAALWSIFVFPAFLSFILTLSLNTASFRVYCNRLWPLSVLYTLFTYQLG